MSAYEKANVVVHIRVRSEEKRPASGPYGRLLAGTYAKVEVIEIFKGSFTRDTVFTTSSSSCGVGGFNVGADYVLFLDSQYGKVHQFDQPWFVTTGQILEELSAHRGNRSDSVSGSSSP
jgi:hypothetical protein